MHRVYIHGHISIEPELRTSKDENKVDVCRVSIASYEGKKKDGTVLTEFFNCVAFNKMAHFVADNCPVGSERIFWGRIKSSEYEKDGQKKYRKDLIIDRIEFCGKRDKVEKDTVIGEGYIDEELNAIQGFDEVYNEPFEDSMIP